MTGITEKEREARRAAVSFARASVELEGFDVSDPDETARDERFINGELTYEEYGDPSDLKALQS